MIGQLKASYLSKRRDYIHSLIQLIPWGELTGAELNADGSIKFGRPDLIGALSNVLNGTGDWHSSIVYDWTRVMYNSWGCENTLKVAIPSERIWGPTYLTRTPFGHPQMGLNPVTYSCTTTYEAWAVSTDGGATWTTRFLPTTICEPAAQ